MKKDVKIWYVIAILAIFGVTIASAGFEITPDYPAITDVHSNSRVSDSNAKVISLDVVTPDESIPEQSNSMRGEDIICMDDGPKIRDPNADCPPYCRGTESYRSEKESGFNKSENATWLNITSDATTISFTNVYTDYGIDTDGDGKYNYLAIDVRVNVKTAGKYRIDGSLKDHSTGDHIVSASTYRILDVGVQDVTLKFNGYPIYRHGASVKCDLKDLKIYDKDLNRLDYRSFAYTTSYYSYTYFDVPPVDIRGSYSNYGIDTDNDGKYNYLAIDAWVNVKEAGYYSLGGWLDEDGNKHITYASTYSQLNKGLQKLTLKFNGMKFIDVELMRNLCLVI